MGRREKPQHEFRQPGVMGQVKDVGEASAPKIEDRRFGEQVGVETLPVLETSDPPGEPHLVES